MTVLRVVAVRFVRDGADVMAPFSLELGDGDRARLEQPHARGAAVAARVAAGIVKPTFGAVTIADFDSRLQPAQAKRIVGFVPRGGFTGSEREFAREIGFRADVWNVDRAAMHAEADTILRALRASCGDAHDAYLRGVALALAPGVRLAVMELAPDGVFETVAALDPRLALVATAVATGAHAAPSVTLAETTP
jgi:energy-coupling factor transporter ATP-binding protein EcfA2